MRSVLWVIASLAALIAAAWITGWLLPVGHVASRSASFSKSAGEVYSSIAEVTAYPQWWSDVSRVELLPASPGAIRFRQETSHGPIVMEVAEASPPHRFVTRIADPDQPFGGTWTFEISSESPKRSRLTITERGEVYNPIFRFMSRFVFGHTKTMESFLSALTAHVNR